MSFYFEQIQFIFFKDFTHAWILVSLLYIISTVFIHFLLGTSVKRAEKRISSKNIKSIHQKYLGRSISGWLIYIGSLTFFLCFWYAHHFHVLGNTQGSFFYLVSSAITFLLSVIFHLTAYATSALDQIKVLEDKQLTP